MATRMIRVSESDVGWLTAFAGELQTARASRVSIAEAISTLIVEHREAERKIEVATEDIPQEVLDKIWTASEKKANRMGIPVHLVYGQAVVDWQRYR